MELTSIKEVREAAENGTHALKKLLNSMEDLDQGKIATFAFENARDVIECSECHKPASNEGVLESGRCANCAEKVRKEKLDLERKRELAEKWSLLLSNLNIEAGKPAYELNETRDGSMRINRIDDDKHYCTIYRETLYNTYRSGYYFSRPKGHALRISTDYVSVKADWLGRDFGSPNVAKHLHKKCDELLEKITEKEEQKVSKAKAEIEDTIKAEQIVSQIVQTFNVKDMTPVYPRKWNNRSEWEDTNWNDWNFAPISYLFTFEHLHVATSTEDEGMYQVRGIVSNDLPASKVKELSSFIKTLQ